MGIMKPLHSEHGEPRSSASSEEQAFHKCSIRLLQERLKSCTAFLHLMITTLDFARRLAARRLEFRRNKDLLLIVLSLRASPKWDQDDEQTRELIQSLVQDYQDAKDNLGRLDDAVREERSQEYRQQSSEYQEQSPEYQELTPDSPSYESSVGPDTPISVGHGNSLASWNDMAALLERTSLLLNWRLPLNGFFGDDMSSSCANRSQLSIPRLSVIITNALLQKWTDQSDPLYPTPNKETGSENEQSSAKEEKYQTKDAPVFKIVDEEHASDPEGFSNQFTSRVYPESQNIIARHGLPIPAALITPWDGPMRKELEADTTIPKMFRICMDDTTSKVLQAGLQTFGIQRDWRTYALWIVCDNQARCLGLEQKPLVIFKGHEKEGKRPIFFMLRKLAETDDESSQS